MKKKIILLITLLLILSMVGCGAKEKASEKISEKIIENSTGAKVDIDGDKMKIKTEDGTHVVTIGATEWPESGLVANIPEFKEGKVSSVMNSENYVMIVTEKVKQNSFKVYLDEIKKDFSKNALEMNADGVITYGAESKNGNEVNVMLSYDSNEKMLSIAITQPEK